MALETLTTTLTSGVGSPTQDGDGTNASTSDNLFGGGLAPAPLIPAFLFTGLLVAIILAMIGYRRVAATRAVERARIMGGYEDSSPTREKNLFNQSTTPNLEGWCKSAKLEVRLVNWP